MNLSPMKIKLNNFWVDGHVYLSTSARTHLNELGVNIVDRNFCDVQYVDYSVDGLIATWNTKITESLIAKFPSVKVVFLRCTSDDNVDLIALKKRNIKLFKIHSYGDNATSEYVISKILFHSQGMNPRKEISGKKLGIVGFGNVGRLVYNKAVALGMNVIVHSRAPIIEYNDETIFSRDLDRVFSECDYVSIHTPSYTKCLPVELLNNLKEKSLLIMTTLGIPFHTDDFISFCNQQSSVDIVGDLCCFSELSDIKEIRNLYVDDFYSARTAESILRAEDEVINNIMEYMKHDI